MKRILVPVDGSAMSDRAVAYVVATFPDTQVCLLHVEAAPTPWQTHGMEPEAIQSHLHARGLETLKSAHAILKASGTPHEVHVVLGEVAETWAHYLHMVDLLETAASYQLGVAAGGLSVVLLLAACGKSEAPPAAAGGGMPPPEVGVVVATPGNVGLVTELPGRLEASRVAQVRARAADCAAGNPADDHRIFPAGTARGRTAAACAATAATSCGRAAAPGGG